MTGFHVPPKKKPGDPTPQKALDAAWHSDNAYAVYLASVELRKIAANLRLSGERLLASKVQGLANEAEQRRANMMKTK
jgi:hypothetical protein